MKRLILTIPIVLLAACAGSESKKVAIPRATPAGKPVHDLMNVRQLDQVSQYRFGRYVDPNNRLIMHEAHPVYRIETPARWQLQSSNPLTKGLPTITNRATTSTQPDEAVIAEVNKQKVATKAFTEQTATLNTRLVALTEAVSQTKKIAEQQLLQQRDIVSLKSHLNAVETNRVQEPAAPVESSSATPEENW